MDAGKVLLGIALLVIMAMLETIASKLNTIIELLKLAG